MKNIIEFKGVSFFYNDNLILDNLNFSIPSSKWVSIVGPNGAGKSTLLKLMTGFSDSYKGDIYIDDKKLSKKNLFEIRKRIGFIFQDFSNQFICENVRDEILFSLCNLNFEKKEMFARLSDVVSKLNIEDLLDKSINELSGGEKQKVILASVLIYKPEILIFDESFSMLDFNTKEEILNLIKEIQLRDKTSVVFVTHNLEETLFSDMIMILNDGKIVSYDNKFEVYKRELSFLETFAKLPFFVEFSYNLMFYELLSYPIFDSRKMVDKLWK